MSAIMFKVRVTLFLCLSARSSLLKLKTELELTASLLKLKSNVQWWLTISNMTTLCTTKHFSYMCDPIITDLDINDSIESDSVH